MPKRPRSIIAEQNKITRVYELYRITIKMLCNSSNHLKRKTKIIKKWWIFHKRIFAHKMTFAGINVLQEVEDVPRKLSHVQNFLWCVRTKTKAVTGKEHTFTFVQFWRCQQICPASLTGSLRQKLKVTL